MTLRYTNLSALFLMMATFLSPSDLRAQTIGYNTDIPMQADSGHAASPDASAGKPHAVLPQMFADRNASLSLVWIIGSQAAISIDGKSFRIGDGDLIIYGDHVCIVHIVGATLILQSVEGGKPTILTVATGSPVKP